MSNFDNYTPTTIESYFKSQLVLSKKKGKHVKSESDSSDDEINELEALVTKRLEEEEVNTKVNYLLSMFHAPK